MSENRKNYPKLIRDPYEFGNDTNKPSADDTASMIRQCECDGNPGLDPNPGSCLVDEYTICGTAGIDDDVSLAEIPQYYLRVRSGPEPNPDVIFIPSFGEGGGCFSKGDQIACSEAVGFLLGMDQYFALPSTDEDPACALPPCVGPNCQWLRLELCTNDPSYPDVDPFEIVLPISYFGGFGLGNKVVKYQGHCYETPTIPCLEAPYEGATVPTFEEIEIITTEGCENDQCTCCSNVMEVMDLLNTGIKERLKFVNGGVLPGGVDPDHDWDDPDYILNSASVEVANGDDEETPCQDRYETWRLWLVEIYYWLTSSYLLNASVATTSAGWLDEAIEGNVSIVTTASTVLTDFGTEINDLNWFTDVFEGPNSADEIYTNGALNVGGLGTSSVIRFGDVNPRVVVNTGEPAWCNLVNATVDVMMEYLQLLQTVVVLGTQTSMETKATVASGGSCAQNIACSQASHGGTAWGNQDTYNLLCALTGSGAVGSATIRSYTNAGTTSNTRGKITVDLSFIDVLYADGAPSLFARLTFADVIGQTRPHSQPLGYYGEIESEGLEVGANAETTDYVVGSDVAPTQYDCTGLDTGWGVENAYATVQGVFTV